MIQKPILINSYPRSGSVFFAESLMQSKPKTGDPFLAATVIHIPELIGIKEALTVTIIRDPIKSIASNTFKRVGVVGAIQNMDDVIKFEENDYLRYIEAAVDKGAYVVDFKTLSQDPDTEIAKFLLAHGLDSYETPPLEKVQSVFEKHGYKNDLHNGHFPREVDKDVDYNRIYDYLNTGILEKSQTVYLKTMERLGL